MQSIVHLTLCHFVAVPFCPTLCHFSLPCDVTLSLFRVTLCHFRTTLCYFVQHCAAVLVCGIHKDFETRQILDIEC